jgi:hypothetical protein
VPARLRKGERSVMLCIRVPVSYAAWLKAEGGKRRGAVSKVIRRLIKEEAWRREGKYVQLRHERNRSDDDVRADVAMRSAVQQRRLKTLPRRRFGRKPKPTAVAEAAEVVAVGVAE